MLPPAQQSAEEQQANPMYTCGVCGEPVVVFDGKCFRTCDHVDAPVIANLQAIVRGQSGLS